ncbi:hypothetical protein Bca52824_075116 [Brassica carinata]|uniref:Uncharacterized protein n=1 Tax=Brassica carinata TaxID=52824 RepID=A0A8X7PSA3_BRACI|nr:hypothetical protein Bca52824_075116 [Brassica carinata]
MIYEIKATDVDVIPKIPHLLEAVSEREFTLTVWCQDEEKRRNNRICDMLFTATSHRLADFIFSLGNYCLQLSDRERIDVKLKITSDLMFVNQLKYNFPIFSHFMVENRFNREHHHGE